MKAPTRGLTLVKALREEAEEVRGEYRVELMNNAATEIESLCQQLKDSGIAGSSADAAYCHRAIRFHNDLVAVLQTFLAEDGSIASRTEALEIMRQIENTKAAQLR